MCSCLKNSPFVAQGAFLISTPGVVRTIVPAGTGMRLRDRSAAGVRTMSSALRSLLTRLIKKMHAQTYLQGTAGSLFVTNKQLHTQVHSHTNAHTTTNHLSLSIFHSSSLHPFLSLSIFLSSLCPLFPCPLQSSSPSAPGARAHALPASLSHTPYPQPGEPCSLTHSLPFPLSLCLSLAHTHHHQPGEPSADQVAILRLCARYS